MKHQWQVSRSRARRRRTRRSPPLLEAGFSK
jgi:hypothetical protein